MQWIKSIYSAKIVCFANFGSENYKKFPISVACTNFLLIARAH